MNKDAFNKNSYFKGKSSGYLMGYKLLNSLTRWKPIIKEIMKYKKEGRILDIGCAYGYLLKFLPNYFNKYGIEISTDAVLIAKREAFNANIVSGDFIQTKFEDNYFDVITALETLEHLPELRDCIEKIHNLLKKDGYFIVSFPVVESNLQKRWFTQFDKTHINPSGKVLNEINRKFEIISVKYTFDMFKMITISRFKYFPVHHAYFIVARKR